MFQPGPNDLATVHDAISARYVHFGTLAPCQRMNRPYNAAHVEREIYYAAWAMNSDSAAWLRD